MIGHFLMCAINSERLGEKNRYRLVLGLFFQFNIALLPKSNGRVDISPTLLSFSANPPPSTSWICLEYHSLAKFSQNMGGYTKLVSKFIEWAWYLTICVENANQ